MTFRYSGSKGRLIKYLPKPQGDTIIEPYAGSAAYSLHYRPRVAHFAEKSLPVRALWNWLRSEATPDDLRDLAQLPFEDKQDVRSLGLPLPAETLLRLTCSGVYVGQLSSWALYRQHKVNFDKLIEALSWIKQSVQEVVSDASLLVGLSGWYFIDPPYANTEANYDSQDCRSIHPGYISALATGATQGIITYGHEARSEFPSREWHLAKQVKVPLIRTGGIKLRNEHYSYLPWDKQ